MAASTEDKARVRRMTAEPTTTPYTDEIIAEYIERYPIEDADQNLPDDTDWTPTYDLHAAAADIWDEKAAGWQNKYNFSADGGRFDRNQAFEAAQKKAQYHRARSVVKSADTIKEPDEPATSTDYNAENDYSNLE